MSQNFHNMILVDVESRIIPLARLPLKDYPSADFSRRYKVHPSIPKLNFWHMFQALNPWVKSEPQATKDKIWDETWEVAVKSNWATEFKMKKIEGVDKEAAVTTDDTADTRAKGAVDNGTGASVGSGLESPQAAGTWARGEAAVPGTEAPDTSVEKQGPPGEANAIIEGEIQSGASTTGKETGAGAGEKLENLQTKHIRLGSGGARLEGKRKSSVPEVVVDDGGEGDKACDGGLPLKKKVKRNGDEHEIP